MNNGFVIKELNWDSEYFGVECARIRVLEELNNRQFSILNKVLKDYEFVTIDNVIGTPRNNKVLCSIHGNYLVDVPLTFTFALSAVDKSSVQSEFTVLNNVPIDKRIESISEKSFSHGRFYKDPLIDKNVADGLYANWIRNAFLKDDKYFVIAEGQKGFVLFSEMDDGLGVDIELIAVDGNERQKGIAKNMIAILKSYAANKGYEYINVVTQADNFSAVNLYERQGFKLVECEYTYHFWNR